MIEIRDLTPDNQKTTLREVVRIPGFHSSIVAGQISANFAAAIKRHMAREIQTDCLLLLREAECRDKLFGQI